MRRMRKFYLTILFILFLLFSFGLEDISAQDQSRGVVMQENVPEIKIKVSDNRLIIENLPKDDVLEIFNIMGVKVYTQRVKAGTNEYPINLPKGFYIIRVGTITKKIAVK